MEKKNKPAENLVGVDLPNGWKVIEKFKPRYQPDLRSNNCYIVENEQQKGFLKAFDLSELYKPGGLDALQISIERYNRELNMLSKCNEKGIPSVVQLLDQGNLNRDNFNELVQYFILEFSENGSLYDCIEDGDLVQFYNKFRALRDIFDGLSNLHENGIMHLDLKAENLVYFISDRITKITDFGSARQYKPNVEDRLRDDFDEISVTRLYAPPECLYNSDWLNNWEESRKKIDLYLVGNIIVKIFTNLSFTSLLKKSISNYHCWDRTYNRNQYLQFLPYLVQGANSIYPEIEERITQLNSNCGYPLNGTEIYRLMKIIVQLCNPDATKRGHPEELLRRGSDNGLYRYRDMFITFMNKCELKLN